MTLPAPGYGPPVHAPKRSKVPIVVLSVITATFVVAAIAGFTAFAIGYRDTEPVRFRTPGTVGVHMTPGDYVLCQPADRSLGPRASRIDSTMVQVRSADTSVALSDLSGEDFCDSFDRGESDDLYEVVEFHIDADADYTVTVSDELSNISGYATVGRRIGGSTFVWLGLGVLAALIAGGCFIALVVVLIVRATRKPKPTWPADGPGPGPGPGWGGGYGPPPWGQPAPGQQMPGQAPWSPGPTSPGPSSPHPAPGAPGPQAGGPAGPWPLPDPPRPPGPPPPYRGPSSG